ncbi:MAG: hypothetical protein PHS17_16140 [Desulfobacterales bacterium]|nr:hypothetical protein [Desulfobacterales bacterium]
MNACLRRLIRCPRIVRRIAVNGRGFPGDVLAFHEGLGPLQLFTGAIEADSIGLGLSHPVDGNQPLV